MNKSTNKKEEVASVAYFYVVQTPKGVVVFKVEDQGDYNDAVRGNVSDGMFFAFYSDLEGVLTFKNDQVFLLSNSKNRCNYIQNDNNVFIGELSNKPSMSNLTNVCKNSLFGTNYSIQIPIISAFPPNNPSEKSSTNSNKTSSCYHYKQTAEKFRSRKQELERQMSYYEKQMRETSSTSMVYESYLKSYSQYSQQAIECEYKAQEYESKYFNCLSQ